MKAGIVDAWGQHPTDRWLNDSMFDSLKKWGAYPKNASAALDLTNTLKLMDTAGVEKMCLSSWHGPKGALISNDEVEQCVRYAPSRFVGVASVDLSNPMGAVDEIKRRCSPGGHFKAVRVLPWLWDLPPTHPRFYPVYVACCEARVPFCLQIGHTGPLMSSEVGRPIYMDRVCLDFPDLKVIGGHIGYPWTDEAIALATKHQNFYIDTSAYTCKRYPKQLVHYMKTNGKRKVLFGTNYPMIEPMRALEDLPSLELDSQTESLFLRENAMQVFGLTSPTAKL